MTILDRFVQFTLSLPDERREEIEDILASIMAGNEAAAFSAEQLAEIDRRLAEEDPEYATEEEVAAVFQRTMRR